MQWQHTHHQQANHPTTIPRHFLIHPLLPSFLLGNIISDVSVYEFAFFGHYFFPYFVSLYTTYN